MGKSRAAGRQGGGVAGKVASYRCYACGRTVKAGSTERHTAVLVDDEGRTVEVGPDCLKKIVECGDAGYQHARGGPLLFATEALRRTFLDGRDTRGAS